MRRYVELRFCIPWLRAATRSHDAHRYADKTRGRIAYAGMLYMPSSNPVISVDGPPPVALDNAKDLTFEIQADIVERRGVGSGRLTNSVFPLLAWLFIAILSHRGREKYHAINIDGARDKFDSLHGSKTRQWYNGRPADSKVDEGLTFLLEIAICIRMRVYVYQGDLFSRQSGGSFATVLKSPHVPMRFFNAGRETAFSSKGK